MMYIAHTDPNNFLSAPNPLRFRSESVIISIRPRIRNRSLSDPIRIREKNMVKDMVEAKSDPIRSVYTPTLGAVLVPAHPIGLLGALLAQVEML